MAKKKNCLGAAAALLLAFGSVLVSCGGGCAEDGTCTASEAKNGNFCGSSNCSAYKDSYTNPDTGCDC